MKQQNRQFPAPKKLCAAALLLFAFAAACFYAACGTTPKSPAEGPADIPTDGVAVEPAETQEETPVSHTPVFVRPARFLTDVCLTRGGDLWVTAEAGGVFRLHDPEKDAEWEDMHAMPGFPKTDHCTAVCEDSQGRIWVGTSNMGVQVFCGGKWRRYDRDTVLSGSHVHDLASSESGLTAVAHEQGVSLYDSKDDSWCDFTVLNGLPPGGVRGVCFGDGDMLYCAMESGGHVRIDVRGNKRRVWRLTAPGTWGKDRAALYPLTATGDGLSSNFCNGISVGEENRVCIACLNGISYGENRRFRFLQGRDLKEKMKEAARPELIAGELDDFAAAESPLKESYVNCVHYGRHGLWIGYRTKGVDLRDPSFPEDSVRLGPMDLPKIDRPVRAFVELPDGRAFCATYGAGLVKLYDFGRSAETPVKAGQQAAAHPTHKSPDPVSVLQDLQRYELLPDDRPECWAQYLGEDWVTKGDWPGRYGARKQVLCAMNAPMSTRPWDGGVSNSPITVNGGIGPHRSQGDSRRSWVDWEQADDNRDVLLQMEYGHRTQSEWNDNGEEYSRTFEGPDLWLTIITDHPEEIWRLSLYFFNSNGRIGDNVERDFIIEVYGSKQGEDLADCMKKQPLCTARVADFASGGVYKSFAMCAGTRYGYPCFRVRLVRYGSLNVILNGIFLDRLFEPQDVRVIPEEERIAEQGSYRAPRWYDCGTDELDGIAAVFCNEYFSAPETAWGISSMSLLRLAFYRYVRDNLPSRRTLAERLRWDAAIWTDADRTEFDAAMKEYQAEIREKYPDRK